MDGQERATLAVVRESKEEIGIGIAEKQVRAIHTMHLLDGRESVGFFFTTDSWRGEIRNMEPFKCDDLSWFPLNALPGNTIPYIRYALECIRQGIPYSEFGWGSSQEE